MSRRDLLKVLAISGSAGLAACLGDPVEFVDGSPRLQSRVGTPTVHGDTGKQRFETQGTDVVAFVPANASWDTPLGLMLFLHGASRNVNTFVDAFQATADDAGVIVLAPLSFDFTWDAIRTSFQWDPERIDDALRWTFARWRIDPARIACTGFSDGATYALAIGRANGDLFPQIVAFSPGFLISVEEVGKPKILITHGNQDAVLSVESTREIIVPDLRYLGYEVDYREFSGPHAVPLETAKRFIESLGAG